jgi:hypothetical protein
VILVDLSQTIIANCAIHKLADKNLIKHSAFSSLLSYKKQYEKKYGKLVLACDSKKYWRRDYFPAYKGHRKHSRDSSDLDWNAIFEAITEIKQDLYDNFPYKILEIEGAEADDIIATLAKYTQIEELIQDGLFDAEPQPTIIISSDGDYVQLQKYKNISQWSPLQKKLVKPKVRVNQYIIEHIVTGDAGDNVPNVLTSDQWAIDRTNNDSTRQKPMKAAVLDSFIKLGIDGCQTEEIKRNYIRNRTLIDFDYIPEDLETKIIQSYINYDGKGNKMKLMSFFTKNKMKLLFAELNNF